MKQLGEDSFLMEEMSKIKLRWRQRSRSTSMATIPKKPGLYAYGKIEYLCGLEKKRHIVYIGESSNVYRRLSEHTPKNEQNDQLRDYLWQEKNVICWYCILENFSEKERREIEKFMIKRLKPRFCIQHNS